MEIAIKDNKRNWQIVKDNRRYLFPPKIITFPISKKSFITLCLPLNIYIIIKCVLCQIIEQLKKL